MIKGFRTKAESRVYLHYAEEIFDQHMTSNVVEEFSSKCDWINDKFYREFAATNFWCIKPKQFFNTSTSDFSISWP